MAQPCRGLTMYIAGPMRNRVLYNFPAFHYMEENLRVDGFNVISPARHDLEIGLDPSRALDDQPGIPGGVFRVDKALEWDLQQIREHADGIVLLDGWEDSDGVRQEIAEAKRFGVPCYRWDPGQRRLVPLAMADEWRGASVPRYTATDAKVPYSDADLRVVDEHTGGEKGTKGIPWNLLPWQVLRELAKHYQRGCAKYSPRNWERGYKWSLSYDSLMNHLTRWWEGEDIDDDPEVGPFPHVIAVVWHGVALAYFWLTGKGTDDRPGKEAA